MSELISNNITAILDKGTSFEGKLSFEGTVQIGGEFKGEIFTKDTLVVNEGANIYAQIDADTIIITGRVEGNLFARRKVIMHPPAVFKGTVTSPSLRIDEGVVFEGASYMPKSIVSRSPFWNANCAKEICTSDDYYLYLDHLDCRMLIPNRTK